MIKKISILLLAIGVLALAIDYRSTLVKESGEELIAHAYYGDLLSVKEAVENGAPLDYTLQFNDEERQYTQAVFNALHAAASSGDEDVINFLIDQGIAIDSQTPEGWTPLFIAARDGRAEAAKLLVFRHAQLNIPSDLGATALLMAATQPYPSEEERLSLLTYMLKRGADPNRVTQSGHPPLYYAAADENLPVVELLLENGAVVTPELAEQIAGYLQRKIAARFGVA